MKQEKRACNIAHRRKAINEKRVKDIKQMIQENRACYIAHKNQSNCRKVKLTFSEEVKLTGAAMEDVAAKIFLKRLF